VREKQSHLMSHQPSPVSSPMNESRTLVLSQKPYSGKSQEAYQSTNISKDQIQKKLFIPNIKKPKARLNSLDTIKINDISFSQRKALHKADKNPKSLESPKNLSMMKIRKNLGKYDEMRNDALSHHSRISNQHQRYTDGDTATIAPMSNQKV